jgi:protein-S-isoprenylcysteine O-methyltransferase Ste14
MLAAGVQPGLPLSFVLGTAVCVLGCALRRSAYAALGRAFTFELAVAPRQRLVTAFPYSIVRHPSYLGGFAGALGADLALFGARGGWARDVLLPRLRVDAPAIATLGIGMCVALQVVLFAGLGARVPSEDRMMKEHFGREWEEWARRVPYKLVPGLY